MGSKNPPDWLKMTKRNFADRPRKKSSNDVTRPQIRPQNTTSVLRNSPRSRGVLQNCGSKHQMRGNPQNFSNSPKQSKFSMKMPRSDWSTHKNTKYGGNLLFLGVFADTRNRHIHYPSSRPKIVTLFLPGVFIGTGYRLIYISISPCQEDNLFALGVFIDTGSEYISYQNFPSQEFEVTGGAGEIGSSDTEVTVNPCEINPLRLTKKHPSSFQRKRTNALPKSYQCSRSNPNS